MTKRAWKIFAISTIGAVPLVITTMCVIERRATKREIATTVESVMNIAPKSASLSFAHHPLLGTSTNPVSLFHRGSDLLRIDDDSRLGPDEDAPVDIQFLPTGKKSNPFPNLCMPSPSSSCIDFTAAKYFDIETETALSRLLAANFSTVKYTNSIDSGYGVSDGGMIVLSSGASPATAMHEWGHRCGLNHTHENDDSFIMFSQSPDEEEDPRKKIDKNESNILSACK